MTHALQVLHTLQWHHPGGRAHLQLAQAPTQDYHSCTHALLGVVEDEVTSPNLGGSSCMVKLRPKLPLHGTAKK